jgi:hypothetical protein
MVYFANFPHILLYVRLTFLHNQTRWATCFIRVLCRITGIARVAGVIYSTDPIFSSGRHVFYMCAFRMKSYEGWHALFKMNMSRVMLSPHVSYVCIPHVEYARKGYTQFKRRVSEVGRCPCSGLTHGYRFYSERYCMWMLPWRAGTKGSFFAGT